MKTKLLRVPLLTLALVGALISLPHSNARAQTAAIDIQYIPAGSTNKLFVSVNTIDTGTDSVALFHAWDTIKTTGYLRWNGDTVLTTYARLYRPAYFTSGGSFYRGVLVDTAGTSPSAGVPTFTERVSPPASATDPGKTSMWAADTGYIYICTANGTWKRAALSSW